MPSLIKHGQAQRDDWHLLRQNQEGGWPSAPDVQDVLVPLNYWLSEREALIRRRGRVGVWLAPDDEPRRLAADLPRLPVVAVDFPVFTDGRGYSLARLLRERYHYAGELRAIGDVWQDLAHALAQVGFDAFAVKDGKAADRMATSLQTFSEQYQSTWRQPEPLFRRRVTLL